MINALRNSVLFFLIVIVSSCAPSSDKDSPFSFEEDEQGVGLYENGKHVFFYQKVPKALDGEYICNNYIHPLFAPNGDIYNCHYKVYTNHKEKLGNLFNEEVGVHIPRDYFLCEDFGFCNPCDSEGHLFKALSGEVESISGENK